MGTNNNRLRVAVAAHGCKLNQAEVDVISRRFVEAGYVLVDQSDYADVYVLNSCSVTHVADSKARQWLRKARRKNPKASIIATGCYATRAPNDIEELKVVDLIVSNHNKDSLAESTKNFLATDDYKSVPTPHIDSNGLSKVRIDRVRRFIKVQEGCNQFCAFCVIPFTRGRESNVPMQIALTEIQQRMQEGCKEVVITGPQIGSYGTYPPTPEYRCDPQNYSGRLHGLIEKILSATELPRLRISSIQPQDLTNRLLDALKQPRVCRHVHMALQSGSDTVLDRMGRRYRTEEFRDAVIRLRTAVPGIAVTTDVMVGFPGETDAEFDEGHKFCEEMGFAGLHLFPYSNRPGTRASSMNKHITSVSINERMGRMALLADETKSRFQRQFVGSYLEVLWEEQVIISGESFWSGLSDNYIKVYCGDSSLTANKISSVFVIGEISKGLLAQADT